MKKEKRHFLIDQIELSSWEDKSRKSKNKEKQGMKWNGDKIFYVIGLIALSPFIVRDCIVEGFKWLVKKIKRKRKK
tara:strand:- start:464 stop:691 length:228 start_codon:yes stop_codon:yes gene_type:complete